MFGITYLNLSLGDFGIIFFTLHSVEGIFVSRFNESKKELGDEDLKLS